jgi:hypothetical protein
MLSGRASVSKRTRNSPATSFDELRCHARTADARRDRNLRRLGCEVLHIDAELVIRQLPLAVALIRSAVARLRHSQPHQPHPGGSWSSRPREPETAIRPKQELVVVHRFGARAGDATRSSETTDSANARPIPRRSRPPDALT